jgi:hypothetical protein
MLKNDVVMFTMIHVLRLYFRSPLCFCWSEADFQPHPPQHVLYPLNR